MKGNPVPGINGYLTGVSALLTSAPERGLEFAAHWGTAFFLPAILEQPTQSSSACARLMMSLLFEKLQDGSSPLKAHDSPARRTLMMGRCTRSQKTGAFDCDRLAEPNAQLIWQCGRNSATLRAAENVIESVEVALPLTTDGTDEEVAFLPFSRTDSWSVPVIESGKAALLLEDEYSGQRPEAGLEDGSVKQALPLSVSLWHAHQILKEAWPEVLPWAKPSYRIRRHRPSTSQTTRLSGSFGPGIPIYLSKVTDPFAHAEDIVHELHISASDC